MSRRTLTAIELPAVSVVLAVCSWTLAAQAHIRGHAPWMPLAAAAAITALAIVAPAAGYLLLAEARRFAPRARHRRRWGKR